MKYSAIEVAKYILTQCTKSGSPISNLKLQKLLYFVQDEYLKVNNEALFTEEVCAWKFGPVVPEAYYYFCAYGGTDIRNKYMTDIELQDKKIINQVIDQYQDTPVWQLVEKNS